MFRKIIHITISLILLTVTTGYSISKHYCHNRLVSVSISHEAENCCDMEGTMNCCRNETKSFQLEEDFVSSPLTDNSELNQIDLLFPLFYVIVYNTVSTEIETFYRFPESPPPLKIQVILSDRQTYLC